MQYNILPNRLVFASFSRCYRISRHHVSFLAALFVGALAFDAQAQNPARSSASVPAPIEISPYAVKSRDANQRIWERVTAQTSPDGNVTYQTNSYTELATGMHYRKDGQWVESSEEIQIAPDGAVATHGQHQVAFAANINTAGAIDLTTPDGKHLRSHILGLSYFDPTTGKNVLIAELKDSIGELLPTKNQVLYADAFTDFKADVRYTYTKAGFEQDIILREQPPLPTEWGLNPATTRLEVLTEFLNPPAAKVKSQSTNRIDDSVISFGQMQIGHGKAFMTGTNSGSAKGLSVRKHWQQLEGRQFLIEEVKFPAIERQIMTLPAPPTPAATNQLSAGSILHRVLTQQQLPPPKLARRSAESMKLASAAAPARGFVLDYVTLNTDTNDFTFQADTTYSIQGYVISGGAITIEGGTVIKFNNSLDLGGSLVLNTAPYRPGILTSINDNTVGETISGSSGNPSSAEGIVYLDLEGNPSMFKVSNLRFSYAGVGLDLIGQNVELWNCQFVNCYAGIEVESGIPLTSIGLHNVLFGSCSEAINSAQDGLSIMAEHVTADAGFFVDWVTTPGSLFLTNSIINGSVSAGAVATNAVVINPAGTPFQTVGAGNYYLADNSPYRNVGTTNISADMLANLKQTTTYPPLLFTNITVSVNTTLSPQAQRDTDTPDLGYHYDPLDYLVDTFAFTNAVVTVTNGAAIASYNDTGLWIQDGSAIVSIGTPLAPNWFVRYNSVQEQSLALGPGITYGVDVNPYHYGTVGPTGTYRFTQFASPAGASFHLYSTTIWAYTNLLVQDCSFWNGKNDFSGSAYGSTIILNNNLFDRSLFNATTVTNCSLVLSNNLFWHLALTIRETSSSPEWDAFNNAFDTCTIGFSTKITNGYNAYINCGSSRLNPNFGNHDLVLTNFVYTNGPLGSFYQVSTNLHDAGSTTADLVSLYHYTTTANQVKETNSIVDIGLHYVATTNGVPIDTDGEGLADYFEDTNGNGVYDAGDFSDYTQASTSGDGVSDYLKWLQGRNPRVAGTNADVSGVIKLNVYTPLK
ncbi:MAG: hypothetical protein JWR19_4595 [Pedosphaera sp.]|nr:hypothetical protein [Pedosphaera sp.]